MKRASDPYPLLRISETLWHVDSAENFLLYLRSDSDIRLGHLHTIT
jgi:hypothetical protein